MSDYFDDYFDFDDDSSKKEPTPEAESEPAQEEEPKEYRDPYEADRDVDWRYVSSQSEPAGSSPSPKKPKNRIFARVLCAVLAVALVFGAVGTGVGHIVNRKVSEAIAEQQTQAQKQMEIEVTTGNQIDSVQTNYNGSAALTDVSDIAANVAPSIVSINCNIVQNIQDFFGRTYQQEGTGSGSGIIIGQNSENVLIVTNNHVVANAVKVSVEFGNGESVDAAVVGTSANYDLAVVSVKIEDIPEETFSYIRVAALGDSESLRVGEMAIAYGNALGYGPTVTVGYVSALNRQVSYEDFSMELIQTDAAINPGNSGGALLNARGEVIGINSVKYSSTEVEGIGFAIPISDALPVINELINQKQVASENGEVYLGIVPYNVTEQYSKQFHMPIGIYVTEVASGSPAQAAGIQMGDIITSIQGRSVQTSEELAAELAGYTPGDTVTITVQRVQNGHYVSGDVTVKLGSK
ncbi:MAG: trypsin-like peptidase domain-containing protein [Lachnospiraceae bacterium]|nr:trypsin-like peptidase domain-containing protein [Lachnospiraceae bacterium]